MAELSSDLENAIFLNKNPKLTLGGIPAIEQNFVWLKTPGITPYTTNIRFPKQFLPAINALSNPTDLVINVKGGVGVQNLGQDNDIVIKNVFVHEAKETTEFHVSVSVSDMRFQFRGAKTFFNYNETRITNDVAVINPTQLTASLDTNPAALRAPFDTFFTGRYVRSSVNANGTPVPFSVIMKNELAKKGVNIALPGNISQFDYVMDNVRSEGEDFYSSISSLLARTRMQLGIRLDGTLELYPIDFFDLTTHQSLIDLGKRRKSQAGELYIENKRRTRPSKVFVRFEKMQETLIKLEDTPSVVRNDTGKPNRKLTATDVTENNFTNQQQIAQRFSIACTNVVQANFVPLSFLNLYNVGEYVEIKEYLGLFGLSEDLMRNQYFGDLLVMELNFFLSSGPIEDFALAGAIAANIKNSYRQLFMIDPFHMDRIKKLEAKRVSVVDIFSGTRPPSPLFQDYTIVPRVKDIRQVRGQTSNNRMTKSVRVDSFDPLRNKQTLGTVRVVNPELGIFRVSYPPVTDSTIMETIPSALEIDCAINPTVGNAFLAEAILDKNHTMETLMSVIWNYDENGEFDSKEKYHEIEYDFRTASPLFGSSEGPPVTFLCNREYARFDRNNKLLNSEMILAIASAEMSKIMHRFRDRVAGHMSLPEFIDFPLTGNCNSIGFILSPVTGLSTDFDFSSPSFDPQIEQAIPENVRAYLYRQLQPNQGP